MSNRKEKPGPTAAQRKKSRKVAKILGDERGYRKSLGETSVTPELRPQTKQALKELGIKLSPSEELNLALSGRSDHEMQRRLEVEGFQVAMAKAEPLSPDELARRLLGEQIFEEDFARLSPARQQKAIFEKQAAERQLQEASRLQGEAQVAARGEMIRKIEAQISKMTNDQNYSIEELAEAHQALAQLQTPGSCNEACAAAVSRLDAIELRQNQSFREILQQDATAAQNALAEFEATTAQSQPVSTDEPEAEPVNRKPYLSDPTYLELLHSEAANSPENIARRDELKAQYGFDTWGQPLKPEEATNG